VVRCSFLAAIDELIKQNKVDELSGKRVELAGKMVGESLCRVLVEAFASARGLF